MKKKIVRTLESTWRAFSRRSGMMSSLTRSFRFAIVVLNWVEEMRGAIDDAPFFVEDD
jgi:hypothetical protein